MRSCQMPCRGGYFYKGPKSICVRRSLALATKLQVSRWNYMSSEWFKGINTYDFHVACGSLEDGSAPLHLFRRRFVVVTPSTRGTIVLNRSPLPSFCGFASNVSMLLLHVFAHVRPLRRFPVGCVTYLLALSFFLMLPSGGALYRPFVSLPQSAGPDAIC
ncbi:hypothetical protein EV401DRAFT_1946692 [Pisolithus croceorrhizus]|nr:hypothetical protein EV401DRAFT_1946692 [Pisolithus croceorrhizus]